MNDPSRPAPSPRAPSATWLGPHLNHFIRRCFGRSTVFWLRTVPAVVVGFCFLLLLSAIMDRMERHPTRDLSPMWHTTYGFVAGFPLFIAFMSACTDLTYVITAEKPTGMIVLILATPLRSREIILSRFLPYFMASVQVLLVPLPLFVVAGVAGIYTWVELAYLLGTALAITFAAAAIAVHWSVHELHVNVAQAKALRFAGLLAIAGLLALAPVLYVNEWSTSTSLVDRFPWLEVLRHSAVIRGLMGLLCMTPAPALLGFAQTLGAPLLREYLDTPWLKAASIAGPTLLGGWYLTRAIRELRPAISAWLSGESLQPAIVQAAKRAAGRPRVWDRRPILWLNLYFARLGQHFLQRTLVYLVLFVALHLGAQFMGVAPYLWPRFILPILFLSMCFVNYSATSIYLPQLRQGLVSDQLRLVFTGREILGSAYASLFVRSLATVFACLFCIAVSLSDPNANVGHHLQWSFVGVTIFLIAPILGIVEGLYDKKERRWADAQARSASRVFYAVLITTSIVAAVSAVLFESSLPIRLIAPWLTTLPAVLPKDFTPTMAIESLPMLGIMLVLAWRIQKRVEQTLDRPDP